MDYLVVCRNIEEHFKSDILVLKWKLWHANNNVKS